MTRTVTREDVVAEARSWIGTRWIHQGRNRHGVDCIGLVVVVRRELGLGGYDVAGYPREPDGTFLAHFFNAGGVRVGILKAQPADLLLFKDARSPCHVGIITARNDDTLRMTHAAASRRKVVEELVIHEWQRKWVAAIQMPELADG
jgi:cell wall-associated NlpC family hydrolase